MSKAGELVLSLWGEFQSFVLKAGLGKSHRKLREEGRQELLERNLSWRHPCPRPRVSSDGGLRCHQEHWPIWGKCFCVWNLEADWNVVIFRGRHVSMSSTALVHKDGNGKRKANSKAMLTTVEFKIWGERNIRVYQMETETSLWKKQFYSQSSK